MDDLISYSQKERTSFGGSLPDKGQLGMGIIDPNRRLKNLSDYGNSVDIDYNIPPRR